MIRSFNGKNPKIAESAFISEAAYVVGDIEIGENSSVWPGAVIRADKGYTRIGKNTNVQDNSVIHGTGLTIGDNVHIGHCAVINCTSIGNHVLIGMNATLLHDVEIGDYCVIGANCLVSQGMKVPDNSFVIGVPAEIKGHVSPQTVQRWLEEGPEGMVKLAAQYKGEGL
jgi:carbonic anhydrase/acetyltransferase-like protein (isoleucine patch superfamily)